MWHSALIHGELAARHLRALLGVGEAVDAAVLADPTLTGDALLAQMQASMASGF